MEPNMTRTTDKQVQLFDETGHLIGIITRPVVTDILGPGREKVYMSRRQVVADRTSHAA